MTLSRRDLLVVAVLDTNTLLSGYRSRRNSFSPTGQIFEAALAGRFLLATSDRALYELADKAQVALPLDASEALFFVEQIAKLSQLVRILGLNYRVRDERDNFWIETALNAGAMYLVTRDRDLLDDRVNREHLAKHGTEIVNPEQFLGILKRSVQSNVDEDVARANIDTLI
jgi:putative PIN family toxin of toxin-antitoxin system